MNLEFKDAKYNNEDKTTFDLLVKDTDGEILGGVWFPFTYLCDGTDDDSSPTARAVAAAYRAGELVVSDWVKPAYYDDLKASEIRAERNHLLAQSDYFIQPDYPACEEDKELVRAYRSALRDLPEQEGFPHAFDWPLKPECLA